MNAWRRGGGRGRGTQDVASSPCWLEPRPDSGREGGKGEGRVGGQSPGVTGDPLPTSAPQVPRSASSSLAESRRKPGRKILLKRLTEMPGRCLSEAMPVGGVGPQLPEVLDALSQIAAQAAEAVGSGARPRVWAQALGAPWASRGPGQPSGRACPASSFSSGRSSREPGCGGSGALPGTPRRQPSWPLEARSSPTP